MPTFNQMMDFIFTTRGIITGIAVYHLARVVGSGRASRWEFIVIFTATFLLLLHGIIREAIVDAHKDLYGGNEPEEDLREKHD